MEYGKGLDIRELGQTEGGRAEQKDGQQTHGLRQNLIGFVLEKLKGK